MYDELSGSQRRVRHIQGVYIKNLTPFPIRDQASSALQQSANPVLQPSDDTDLVLARRRSRRISQNSVVTLRSIRAEAHGDESPEKYPNSETPRTPRTRPAGPPVSFPRAGPSGSPPSFRRQRSISHTSLGSPTSATHSRDFSQTGLPTSPSATAGSFFHYPSQRNLEKVMSSRLVETLVTLSTPDSANPKGVRSNGNDAPKSPSSPTGERSPVRGSPARRFPPANKINPPKHAYHSSEPSPLRSSDPSGVQTTDLKPPNGTSKTSPTALKSKRSVTNGSARPPSTSSVKSISFPQTPSPPSTRSASPARSIHGEESSVPFFISSVHRPSTNPCWTDLDASGDFAEWTDRHQSQLTVTLWGRVDECSAWAWSNLKGKAKDTSPDDADEDEWKILVEWDIQLDKLEKVEPSLLDHPSHLPSNTLLLSLAPLGDLYYIPPSSHTRPASATGYASDSEIASSALKSKPPTRSEILQQSRRETRMKQSATWADIVKLSTLYTVVSDTKVSLDEVVQRTDAIIERGGPRLLARDISEREEHIRTLKQQIALVKDGCTSAAKSIQDRIDQLRARREALRAATEIYDEDVEANEEQTEQVHASRATYLSVHNSLAPRRTTLCNTLESIFPIEPDAERAADLVFTIIGVPLPVPVAPSDPAPPLDNEEAVSAALGYAAHVVVLLSAYLNVRLPYPVTYVGSRSYVRDPISAMHGPRTFPLYPLGVDTYRFEYAVFLLNKDIETLMAEQGLRAIDLRHTLPNLKNLILTLTTHDEVSAPPTIRMAPVQLVLPSEDSSPTPRAASPTPEEAIPAAAPAPSRSKFLSPLSAFLWSRPSSSSRPKVVVEIAEPAEDTDGLTPTAAESQLTPRSSESSTNTSDIGANSSTSEGESHEGEHKAGPPPSANGTEKLGDKVPAETPPSSPFSHAVN
ncbi:Vacuolar sorting 38 and autophagy-related subunit 14 [Ceratobasidium sp. AG-Ba]|nr:Vacuolar sorting 38 and autophagy-related subunit 14 [Ceratobasidium sp. AG-Ba]QRW05054.1 Vacuolar sorting 38 and autophagy-related subunit 14 [Ceratobasidium sp. AG-Ba]